MGLVAAVAAGCQTPSPRGGEPPPAYETLASFHNKRVEMLSRVYARGNVEIRWTDDDGGHFEQGDLDLWIALPDRTALNISKFSERILWLGSRGKWAWVFDFRGDETVLSCVGHEEFRPPGDAAGIFVVPQSLLGLCGLTRLPEPSAEHPSVSHDPHSDVLMVTVSRQDGTRRLFIDRETLLPVGVEDLSAEGALLVSSTINLARYAPVAVEGAGPGQRPMFPTLIDIDAPDKSASIKIAVRRPTNEVEDRFFDLNWLMSAMRPERVEGECPCWE